MVAAAAAAAAATGTAYPVYKRFARKLLCNSTDDSVPGGQMITQSATTTTTVTATKADGRSQKFWAALWKRRPRLSSRWCYGQKKTGARQLLQTTKQARKTTGKQPHGGRRPRRSCCCGFFGKSRRASSSTDSIGALGISPPPPPPLMTNNTFCGKLLRWSTCCGYCHAVPKLFGRVCCCRLCCGTDRGLDAPKKSPGKRSLFKCCTGCCSNKPTKLDAVLVDHTSSVMKGAIPVLPMMLAWFCLVFNVIIPGAGTFSSGLMCLCVGKPRFSVNDNFQSRMGAFCVNFIVAVAQLFTVLFCLVGWGWSIWWGVIMIKIAKKYQKIKVVDHPVETPIAIDQNHQI